MDARAAFVLGMFTFFTIAAWLAKEKKTRELAYRHELYMRMVADPGPGAEAVRALIEQETRRREVQMIQATRTGGMLVLGLGVALGVFFYFTERQRPVFLVGLMPGVVGAVMLIHGSILARRTGPTTPDGA